MKPSQEDFSLTVCLRALVERIRRDEFGVGLPLEGEAAELSARLAARTGRALQRLAAELYSTDSHFVMELVQVGAVVGMEVGGGGVARTRESGWWGGWGEGELMQIGAGSGADGVQGGGWGKGESEQVKARRYCGSGRGAAVCRCTNVGQVVVAMGWAGQASLQLGC